MKQMMNISAGFFLGMSMTMPFIIRTIHEDPVTHLETEDKSIIPKLPTSGVFMALCVGLAVGANKVKK
jgi:hypothetical protein